MKIDGNDALERLMHLASECGYSFQTKDSSAPAKLCHPDQMPIEVDYQEQSNFFWLSQSIFADQRFSYHVHNHIANCAGIARYFGCALRPLSQGSTIGFEIGMSLFFSALSYYTLKDCLTALHLATGECLQLMRPGSTRDQH